MQTNESKDRIFNHQLYQTLTHQANISPALNHSQATLIAQSLLKLFKLSNPKLAQLAYPASPVSSCENCYTGSGLSFLLCSFCLLINSGTSPWGLVWSCVARQALLLLRIISNKTFFIGIDLFILSLSYLYKLNPRHNQNNHRWVKNIYNTCIWQKTCIQNLWRTLESQ